MERPNSLKLRGLDLVAAIGGPVQPQRAVKAHLMAKKAVLLLMGLVW